jgi:hypothetical protein
VMLPNEIEACREFRAQRSIAEPELLFPSSGIKVN